MSSTILFLGVGIDQIPAIQKAKELKLKIIGFDGNPTAAGLRYCEHHEVLDIRDKDLVEKAARKWNKKVGLDGIICPATEFGPQAGRVCDVLGLNGVSEKTADLMTDKVYRRGKLGKAGIPQPRWSPVKEGWDIFPCVIKPRNKSAAQGVKLIENRSQLAKEEFDLVEEYIDGWEISTECVIFDNTFICFHADRNYEFKHKYAPFMLENGCQLPSKINDRIKRKIETLIEKLISLFGLKNCVMKLDLVVRDNIVYVLECPPRLGGGKLSSHMIPLYSGIDYWKLAIKIAAGIPILTHEIIPTKTKFVAQRYKFPEDPKSHKDRLGDVIETGDTYEEAVKKAEEAIRGEDK